MSTSPENKKRSKLGSSDQTSQSDPVNQQPIDVATVIVEESELRPTVRLDESFDSELINLGSDPQTLLNSSNKGPSRSAKSSRDGRPAAKPKVRVGSENQLSGETSYQPHGIAEEGTDEPTESSQDEKAEELGSEAREPQGGSNSGDSGDFGGSTKDSPRNPSGKTGLSFFSSLRNWLASLFPKGREAVTHNEPLEEASEEDLDALSTKEINSRLRKIRSEIKACQQVTSSAKDQVASLEKSIISNDKNARIALEWMSSVEGSYQWKVQEKMGEELQKANNDLEDFKKAVEDVKDFPAGRLIELRKKFHKSLIGPVIFLTPVALLVLLIPLIFTLSRISWLEALYNPQLLAPIASAVTGVVIGAIVVARRALGREKLSNRRIFKWVLVTVVIAGLVSALPAIEQLFRRFILPYIERYTPEILWSVASIIIFWTLLALIFYHIEWSKYKRQVEDQVRRLQGVVAGYTHSTQEVHRLTSLNEQTTSWLEILAHALYRPWRVNPDWEQSGELGSRVESFPFALRVAEVRDEAGPELAELERLISAKLMVQGWRADAFNDLVNQVRSELGLPEGKFSVDKLDKDLPHQTNNTRALLRKYLVKSGETSDLDSQSVPTHDKYLVEVARKRLLDLVNETQSVALSTARPRVSQVLIDPLADIDLDSDSFSDLEDSESWDDFLRESLGTDEILQPPISILNFSDKGRLSRGAESPATFIITPKRLVGALPPSRSDSITIVPVGDNKARSVELIARVDIAGPLESEMLQVLSGADSSAEVENLKLCRQCSDPLCDASGDSALTCSSEAL